MKPNTANELKKHLSQMKAGVAFIGYLLPSSGAIFNNLDPIASFPRVDEGRVQNMY